MKDRIFSGVDVEDALASAAASLGLPRGELRYVVLEAGDGGGRGLKPTPAQIAVLIHEPSGASHGPTPSDRPATAVRPVADASGVPASVRAVVRALGEAGGFSLECELEDGESELLVHLRGEGSAFFLGEDDKGEPLRALEHLLQRICGEALRPRQLRLRCEGFRERRDQALTEQARRLAAEVRADGLPRELEPMNAYERRIVHLALQGEAGVTTYSVGEGPQRRVRIAPDDAGDVDAA